jgi:hypothetical protein
MGSARDTLTHFKSSVKRFKQYLFLVQNQTDCWPNNLSESSCTDLAKLYHCTHFKRSVKPGQLRAAEQAICMHGNKEAQAEFRRFNLDFGLSQVFMRHGWCPKQHLLVFMRHGWCTQSTESVAYARISEHWPAEKRCSRKDYQVKAGILVHHKFAYLSTTCFWWLLHPSGLLPLRKSTTDTYRNCSYILLHKIFLQVGMHNLQC